MDNVDGLRELHDRVGRLEDLDEIRTLYVDYGRYLDRGDPEGYASLFAREAKLRLGAVLRADGREQIEQGATAMMEQIQTASVHILGTPRIDLSVDSASGECVWVAISEAADGAAKVMVGRHVDELVREDGRWCFARRLGYIDIGAV